MGGIAKGMMRGPDGATLVGRWLQIVEAVGIADVVLVGTNEAYRHLGIDVIDDQPSGIGPLGGLLALLVRAGQRRALALACDMPFVSTALLERLLSWPDAPIVAPRHQGRWEPLLARYDPHEVLPIARKIAGTGRHSLQQLLDEAGARELALAAHELPELRDWDTPEDAAR
jgi:molybdopterin-guanine dinucleotide biosynthesis protein A